MNKKFVGPLAVAIATACVEIPVAHSSDEESYVNADLPFVQIEDINRQVEAWAICAAAYDLAAEAFQSDAPANAQQFRDLANGAELAVAMSSLADSFKTEAPNPEKFNATWAYSKVLMQELPKTKRTFILADGEILGAEGRNKFFGKLSATLKTCNSNVESQQMYVDMWRDIAKSGVFQFPGK